MEAESNVETVEVQRFICRHIFTDGHRCGSPSLRGEYFCYFHHTGRKAISDPLHRAARRSSIELPMPEDRAAILLSIGEVLQGIATHTIDRKDAGMLLYGLQIASGLLPRERTSAPGPVRANYRTQPRRSTRDFPAEGDLEKLEPVEETVLDEQLGLIAEPAEYFEPEEKEERRSLARQLLDTVEEYEARKLEEKRQEEVREAIELAVRDARAKAFEEATAEAYANLNDIIDTVEKTATAETEARLRAQFNLPEPETLPIIQAVAGHSVCHSRQYGCHSRRGSASQLSLPLPVPLVCHSRRGSASAVVSFACHSRGNLRLPSNNAQIHPSPSP